MERADIDAARALLSGVPADLTDGRCVGEWQLDWPAYTGLDSMHRLEDPQTSEGARSGFLGWPRSPGKRNRVSPRDDAALALTPDGRLALTGTWGGKVRLWDVRAGRRLKTLDGHREQIEAVDLTPDGRFALTADEEGVICFWDLDSQSSAPERTVTDESRADMRLAAISLSRDGRLACWATGDGRVRVLDTRDGKQWFSRDRHAAGTRAVRISPRHLLAISSGWELSDFKDRDDTARVWYLHGTGGCQHVLRGHSAWVTALEFSADERFAVTGSHDRTCGAVGYRHGEPATRAWRLRAGRDEPRDGARRDPAAVRHEFRRAAAMGTRLGAHRL